MNLLRVCLEEPNCYGFVTWGVTDKYSCFKAPENPLPFDKYMNKKIAYNVLLNTLKSFDKSHPAALSKLKDGNGEPAEESSSQKKEFLSLKF